MLKIWRQWPLLGREAVREALEGSTRRDQG